tara:strand:+ start:88 stop:1158 length:1071 start_codon:yes stop_codon:yes gene_type:complete
MKIARLAGAAVALALASASAAQAQLVLRFADGSPNRGERAAAVKHFAELVAEKSDGSLQVEVHWAGALLEFSAIYKGVTLGTADIGTLLNAYTPKELVSLGVGDLPIGASADPWVGMHAMQELMTTNPEMIRALADRNLVYLMDYHSTGIQQMCRGEANVRKLDDLRGKKVRAAGLYAHALDDLGANVISLTYSDVYQALDSGLIDCTSGYLYAIPAYKLNEVIEDVLLLDWGQVAGFIGGMNKDLWDSLSDAQRQALREAGEGIIDEYARELIESYDSSLEALESGAYDGKVISVYKADAADRARMEEIGAKYVDQWVEDFSAGGYDGAAVLAEYRRLLAKYAKIRDDEGYPWAR